MNSPNAILTKGHIGAAIRFLRQGLPRSGIDNDQNRCDWQPSRFDWAPTPPIASRSPNAGTDKPYCCAFRLVIAFYCLATLDVLGAVDTAIPEIERKQWRDWFWAQQVGEYVQKLYVTIYSSLFSITAGSWGSGFRGSPSAHQATSSVRTQFVERLSE